MLHYLIQLQTYLAQMKLEVPVAVQEKMLEFLDMLQQWNKAFNLTAITEPEKMLTHHLVDSLSIAPYVTGHTVIDVGTGAGLPGVPLALLYPDKQFTLLDSNGKKTRFLLQVKATLPLKNIQVVQERVEKYHTTHCFDDIICRAVGSIKDIIADSQHLLCNDGKWLLMKGQVPHSELSDLPASATVQPLQVPGLGAERHLVIVKPS